MARPWGSAAMFASAIVLACLTAGLADDAQKIPVEEQIPIDIIFSPPTSCASIPPEPPGQSPIIVVSPSQMYIGGLYNVFIVSQNSTEPLVIELLSSSSVEWIVTIATPKPEGDLVAMSTLQLAAGVYTLRAQQGEDVVTSSIAVSEKAAFLAVELDKKIYKPGDNILIRTVLLNSDLFPVANTRVEVEIFTPANLKLDKFNLTTDMFGTIRNTFKLTAGTFTGTWKLKARADAFGATAEVEFEVEEYVLPKFEVVVTPALNFLAQTDIPTSIPVTVDATYVWGEPVMGTCSISFKLPTFVNEYEEIATYMGELDNSGSCFTSFNTSTLSQSNLPLDKTILFEAVVTAAATEETQDGVGELPIKETNVQVEFLSDITFQPGLVFPVTVVVTSADGGPLSGDLNITVDYRTKDNVLLSEDSAVYTTSLDTSGKTTLLLTVPFDDNSCCNPWTVNTPTFTPCPFCFQPSFPSPSACKSCCLDKIEVTVDTGAEFIVPFERLPPTAALVLPPIWPLASAADLTVKRMFSPTNSYLSVTYPGGEVGETAFAGETIQLAVQSTIPDVDVFYVALSRGNIVQSGKVPELIEDDGVFIAPLSLDVTPIMSPELRIVCFYSSTLGGELVVDDLVLPVMLALPSFVTTEFQQTEAVPGQNVSIDVQSEFGSRVFLLAVDKSVEILGGLNSMLTRSAISAEVQAFDTADKPDSALGCHPTVGNIETWSGINILSATEVFQECTSSSFFPNPIFLFSIADSFGGGSFEPTPIEDDSGSGSQSRAREVFPETWLWDEFLADTNDVISITRTVPDTITTWIMSGFSINQGTGLGIFDTQPSLVVLKDFFIEPKLPFSLVRSESVRVVVGIFNYGSVPLSGMVSLIETGFFTAVPLSQEFIVAPQSSSSVDFIITPLIAGELSLFFAGETNSTDEVSDSIIRTLLVVPEGIPTETVTTRVIQSDDEGVIDPTFSVDTILPTNVVPNSAMAQAQLSADFMTATIQGLESLLKIPYGCGEQNMITLVPNLAVLDYLTATNQLEPEIEEKAKNNIRDGIARQLQYQLLDKSFSAFGESDGDGSTWLTAFVYRTFVHASEYVFVDDAVISDILGYLVSIQDSNGSFPEFGRVIHTDMLGGVDNALTLTSYVLLSLIEREPELVPPSTISLATDFVIQETPNISEDYYARVLVAYILELVDPGSSLTSTFGALSLLPISSTSESGETFWAPNLDTPAVLSKTAIAVEMTAYAILAFLASGNIAQASSPARWLIEARNSNGGFFSTQDTVVGLQALAEYSELSLTGADMQITLEPETEGLNAVSFIINPQNSKILQIQDLDVNETYQVQVQGTGSAILSVVLKYNLPEVPLPPKYDLNVTVSSANGGDLITVEACARMIDESTEPSGMMLADIGIFSGYKPVISSLQALATNDANLDMFELADKKVYLYLKEITTETYCASFDIMKEFEVSNIQPVESVIFEYYHPELLGQAVTEFIAGCESVFGDANLDGIVNIQDVVIVVEFIVTGMTSASTLSFECSNSNADEVIDILDVTAILEVII